MGVLPLIRVMGAAINGALNDLEDGFDLGRGQLGLLLGIMMNRVTESTLLVCMQAPVPVPSGRYQSSHRYQAGAGKMVGWRARPLSPANGGGTSLSPLR